MARPHPIPLLQERVHGERVRSLAIFRRVRSATERGWLRGSAIAMVAPPLLGERDGVRAGIYSNPAEIKSNSSLLRWLLTTVALPGGAVLRTARRPRTMKTNAILCSAVALVTSLAALVARAESESLQCGHGHAQFAAGADTAEYLK